MAWGVVGAAVGGWWAVVCGGGVGGLGAGEAGFAAEVLEEAHCVCCAVGEVDGVVGVLAGCALLRLYARCFFKCRSYETFGVLVSRTCLLQDSSTTRVVNREAQTPTLLRGRRPLGHRCSDW